MWDIIKQYEAERKKILEIGNTLSYVYSVSHDMMDKYKIAKIIENWIKNLLFAEKKWNYAHRGCSC
jgi:hypothetical protein